MKILNWNYQGLGNSQAVLALCELVRTHKPDVIFLLETLAHVSKLE